MILALLGLLCGCGNHETPSEPAVLTDTTPTTQATGEEGLIKLETHPQEEVPVQSEATFRGENPVQYSVLERDDSVRNANGDVLVSIRYQQVILDNARPQWVAVNQRLADSYQAFREETAYLQETPPEEWEKMLQEMGAVYGNFMANCTAEVTYNDGAVFSIRMTRDWYMGGVYNGDPFGFNFDVITGEELPLARLSDLPEAEFKNQLVQIVCDYLAPYREILFEDPAEVMAEYTLEDFPYCIEDGELVLLFSTYTFGPGAMGSTVIYTGLYPQL